MIINREEMTGLTLREILINNALILVFLLHLEFAKSYINDIRIQRVNGWEGEDQ